MTESYGKLWAFPMAGMMSNSDVPKPEILIEPFQTHIFRAESCKSSVFLASPTGFEPVLPP